MTTETNERENTSDNGYENQTTGGPWLYVSPRLYDGTKRDELSHTSVSTPPLYQSISDQNSIISVGSGNNRDRNTNMEIYRTDQLESKQIFLPRLVSSGMKLYNENKPDVAVKESDNRFRLPEISMVPNENTSMALNRSITDLLDPETEILNRIKHGSKKKKRRRKRKYVTVTPPTGEEENINRTYCV